MQDLDFGLKSFRTCGSKGEFVRFCERLREWFVRFQIWAILQNGAVAARESCATATLVLAREIDPVAEEVTVLFVEFDFFLLGSDNRLGFLALSLPLKKGLESLLQGAVVVL